MENALEVRIKSANNIFLVPIKTISFLECVEGEGCAVGHCENKTLSEGHNAEIARENLKKYPGYCENWVKLNPEQKKRFTPFLLDYDKEVEKIPECNRRFKNRRGNYTCGFPMREGIQDLNAINGEFWVCCIMGYDIPDFLDCPYNS